jgi:A/G-specific adenine glycosylase
VLLLRDTDGRVLLQRRPPTGVWAALWSLPEAATHEAARGWFGAHVRGDYDHGEPLEPIAHGFTHYRLMLQPLRWRAVAMRDVVGDNEAMRWVARDELAAFGIPAPIRTLLEAQFRPDHEEPPT